MSYAFTRSLGFFSALKKVILSTKKTNSSLPLPFAASAMDGNSSCALVLCGKSSAENETAKTLKNSGALKLTDNTELSILLHSESAKPIKEDAFGVDSFMNSLSTNRFGRFLLWSPRLPSTHDVVSQNFCELPIGAVCVADVQYKGRGRSKNVWESPKGCLLFSFTLQMEDGRVVPLIQYVVSLAVTEAIKDVCDKNGLPYVDVKIKWPNDLYLNGLKVGGILCTSTFKSKQFNVSAGIGLNVDNEKPTTCLNTFLRELSVTTYQFRREDILAAFFDKFEKFYELFINQGFQSLEELYYKTWLHSGQRVIVQEKNDNQVVENVVTIQVWQTRKLLDELLTQSLNIHAYVHERVCTLSYDINPTKICYFILSGSDRNLRVTFMDKILGLVFIKDMPLSLDIQKLKNVFSKNV